MSKFKTRKKFSSFIIYIGLFIMSVAFSIRYLYRENKINEDTLVDILVNDNLGNYKKDIKNADFLLKYALNVDINHNNDVKEEKKVAKEEVVETIKEAPKSSVPILYIFNTHDTEKYQNGNLKEYNMTSGVRLASKLFKEYLEKEGISTIIEENSVQEKVVSLGWKYGYSYKVSRMFLEDAYKNNPSLKYFIDLHRDSSVYDKTTTEINGLKYARVLFVVGLDHTNYEPNLKIATELREKIDALYPNLCRGIMKKSGKGVNGIYNQDFNSNTMLMEIGGQYNNIEEVDNTLKLLASILANFIKERENV